MHSKISPQEAAEATQKILGFYDTIPASDPKGFAAGLLQTLLIFPKSVIDRAVDPVHGIPSVVTYLNLAEVRKHLNQWHAEEARRDDLERRFAPRLVAPEPVRDGAADARIVSGLRELAEKMKAGLAQ